MPAVRPQRLPKPYEPFYCEACSYIPIKLGGKKTTTAELDAGMQRRHRKGCAVDSKRYEEILGGLKSLMGRFDATMLNRDRAGFKIAASDTYSAVTTFSTGYENPCLGLPFCEMPPGDENTVARFIDNLIFEKIGLQLGLDDITIRYLVNHLAPYCVGNNMLLPKIVSFLLDRYIPNKRMNQTYAWWLKMTVRYRLLTNAEFDAFKQREVAKTGRWTAASTPEPAPRDGLDYALMDSIEIATACFLGGSQMEVQDAILPQSSMYGVASSRRSPLLSVTRLLWIHHSGRHNHLEDDSGQHFLPMVSAWQKFIKARRETRSLPEIVTEVIGHLKSLIANGRPVHDCLVGKDQDQFKQVLEEMEQPPVAGAYSVGEIRDAVRRQVEFLKAEKQQQYAGLEWDSTVNATEQTWNQDVSRSLGLALMLMGTTAKGALESKGALNKEFFKRLRTSRLGKALIDVRNVLKFRQIEIDQWIARMADDDQLFQAVRADEIKLAKEARMATRSSDVSAI